MTAVELIRDYEAWLAGVIPHPLVASDIAHKHDLLSRPDDPFPFFRGTYPLWVKRWAEAAGPLADAPRVLAVGDVHPENFGTWRDADGRLCWGVNDFDEVDDLPYTNDLVRLAAGVRFAKQSANLKQKMGEACDRIVTGYREAMRAGGSPFVLEEHHPELRAMAMAADREPVRFWAKMTKLLRLPAVELPAEVVAALTADRPPGLTEIAYRPRPKAGVGSLGRPRFVALAEWRGGWLCREVKATAPPATAWGLGNGAVCRTGEAVRAAVRSHDPFYRHADRWVARRLAPRASRIGLVGLEEVNLNRLFEAMGAELANVHLGTPDAVPAVLAHLEKQPAGWLLDAARRFAGLIETDRQGWQPS